MTEVETMKQAVASLRTKGIEKTVMSGAGTPSYPLGIATGHQNPTERSFAFSDLAISDDAPDDDRHASNMSVEKRGRPGRGAEGQRSCGGKLPPREEKVASGGVTGAMGSTPISTAFAFRDTSPCATCPKRDDCGAKCQEWNDWYYS